MQPERSSAPEGGSAALRRAAGPHDAGLWAAAVLEAQDVWQAQVPSRVPRPGTWSRESGGPEKRGRSHCLRGPSQCAVAAGLISKHAAVVAVAGRLASYAAEAAMTAASASRPLTKPFRRPSVSMASTIWSRIVRPGMQDSSPSETTRRADSYAIASCSAASSPNRLVRVRVMRSAPARSKEVLIPARDATRRVRYAEIGIGSRSEGGERSWTDQT